MHTSIDYSKSPAKAFDAVNDVIEYFGDRYPAVAADMKLVADCGMFSCYCGLAGISGYPVVAWYEHFHGQGSWDQEQVDERMKEWRMTNDQS